MSSALFNGHVIFPASLSEEQLTVAFIRYPSYLVLFNVPRISEGLIDLDKAARESARFCL